MFAKLGAYVYNEGNMVKSLKSKKSLIAVGALLVLGAVGITIAYNASQHQFDNDFPLGLFKTEVTENFTSPADWKPCDTTPKVFTVKNKGNIPTYARVKLDEKWLNKAGYSASPIVNGISLAEIQFSNTDKWELRDGYYYSKDALQGGEELEFMSAVRFNCQADFGENELCTTTSTGTTCSKYNGGIDPYNGGTYHLVATAQFIQADGTVSWDDVYASDDNYVEPQTFAKANNIIYSTFMNATRGGNVPTKRFMRSFVAPAPDQEYLVDWAASDSEYDLKFWYSSSDQTIYFYTTADAVTVQNGDNWYGIFGGMGLTDISGFRYIDMKNVTSLGGMGCGSDSRFIEDWSPISHWDLSSITNIGSVFNCNNYSGETIDGVYFGSYAIKDLNAVAHWKFRDLRTLDGVFSGASGISDLSPLAGWDVSGITSMQNMFGGSSSIKSLHGLEDWDVSHVTNMNSAFGGMSALEDISALKKWDVSNVTTMGGLFNGVYKIKDLSPLRNWNVGKNTSFTGMFSPSFALKDVSPIAGWDVSKGEDFSGMFSGTAVTDFTPLNGWVVQPTANKTNMFFTTGPSTKPTWY